MPAEKVMLTQNIAASLRAYFDVHEPSQVGVLVDENTRKHCYPLVQAYLPAHQLIEIRSGELNKTLETCTSIWEQLTTAHFDRKALLINLGGGVIGDMGGFCAATYKRGISFINLPTTLLSQVDASVGGKLGIDFRGYKNHIGLFQEPAQVFVFPHFIKTLPPEELRSGFAEVIKHSLIQDAAYWPRVKQQGLSVSDWSAHIAHSIKIKSTVVDTDFKESGLRKILNYGHTIGHAVESFYLETEHRLLHGEAIAIGMIAENYLSVKYCNMPQEQAGEINQFLLDVYGYQNIDEQDEEAIAGLSLQDKKNEGSIVKASLLKQIGEATFDIPITRADIREGLSCYRRQKNKPQQEA